MPRKRKQQKRIAVIDFETDPFLHGRSPEPFAAGFYDGIEYVEFWGVNCVDRLISFLAEHPEEFIIFAHNGGKFDFFYLLREGALENPLKMINGRIVKAKIGRHELRDSYAIIPIPLAAYQKDEIDYAIFEKDKREKHKADILHYLAKDCEYLHKLVSAFVDRFGVQLTIGSTAIKELQKLHPFEKTGEHYDERFRPFYYGGRVECFESGLIPGEWQVFDVNSMYPAVMKNALHPTGGAFVQYLDGRRIDANGYIKDEETNKPYFMRFTGKNKGALPSRTKDGLDFNCEYGEFFACSHEIQAGLELGLLEIDEVHEVLEHVENISFGAYVDTHVASKIQAKIDKDKTAEIFAKLLLNSAYGKFGQDGRKFKDFMLVEPGEITMQQLNDGWDLFADYGNFEIWEKPNPSDRFLNVATAASITSASRAVLLRAIHNATRPIYCDTDSLICERLDGVQIHDNELGAWKWEGKGQLAAIAGKKLYALFDGDECVKLASKGVRLTGNEIIDLCNGKQITCQNDAPNFKLNGEVKFISRNIVKRVA